MKLDWRMFRNWAVAFAVCAVVIIIVATFVVYDRAPQRTDLLTGVGLAVAAIVLILLGLAVLARRIRPLFIQLQESEARYRSI